MFLVRLQMKHLSKETCSSVSFYFCFIRSQKAFLINLIKVHRTNLLFTLPPHQLARLCLSALLPCLCLSCRLSFVLLLIPLCCCLSCSFLLLPAGFLRTVWHRMFLWEVIKVGIADRVWVNCRQCTRFCYLFRTLCWDKHCGGQWSLWGPKSWSSLFNFNRWTCCRLEDAEDMMICFCFSLCRRLSDGSVFRLLTSCFDMRSSYKQPEWKQSECINRNLGKALENFLGSRSAKQ